MILTRTTLMANSAQNGGGIYGSRSFLPDSELPTLVLADCLLADKCAAAQGGGIWTERPLEMTDCVLAGNQTAGQGGAVYCRRASTELLVRNCTFFGNAAGAGSGIYVGAKAATALENTIVSFSAAGGAVECEGASGNELACCDVFANSAATGWAASLGSKESGATLPPIPASATRPGGISLWTNPRPARPPTPGPAV